MATLKVKFSGLFSVVRHAATPRPGQHVKSQPEPMTILLPVDHGLFGGTHAMHAPLLHIPETAMTPQGEQALKRLPRATVSDPRYLAFDFTRWRLHLPLTTPGLQPVDHADDEGFDATEPVNSAACALVGSDPDTWKPLSRLPILNHLTQSKLKQGVHQDPHSVQGLVELSGGRLDCVYSKKALRDAFFEFFTEDKTVLIQPAAEDVEYTMTTVDRTVTLGLSPQNDHSDITPVPLLVDELVPFAIISLPPDGTAKPTNLNHFANFYPLMGTHHGKGPFVRMIARCDGNNLVHTMPGINSVVRASKNEPRLRTVETCSCLASQVFADPFHS
jgi:hypothetical protein